MAKDGKKIEPAELRRRAEQRVREQDPRLPPGEVDAQRLLHELLVYEVELEMQNETLKAAQDEALEALHRETEINARLDELVASRTDELLLAKQQAELANLAKSAFLANMSHELRTPLHAIMGMVSLARRSATDPTQQDYLDKAVNSCAHLAAILGDILDLSKIEAERLVLEHASVNVNTVLQNVTTTVGEKAAEKGLALRVSLAPEVRQGSFVGDPLRLGQVLLNLVGNAVKFTERGSVAVTVQSVEESANHVRLRCDVSDTGIGIAADDQQRLFTAFEQADNSTTRKYGGSGLGLAICKRLVGLMGGEIGVASTPGKGSTFWFTVRLEKAAGAAGTVQPPDSADIEDFLKAQCAGARILLADDDPISQEVAYEILASLGFQIETADDGRAAVDLANHQAFDLILMDMQMPNMGGLDATRAIRALPGHEQTPIVAMTANAFGKDRQAGLDAGMNDYITKPYDTTSLFTVLWRWLPRRQCAQPPH